MSESEAQILMRLARVEALLEQLVEKPKPNLKQCEFAKLAGVSRWTVRDKIKSGLIRTVSGRIPRSELRHFTS